MRRRLSTAPPSRGDLRLSSALTTAPKPTLALTLTLTPTPIPTPTPTPTLTLTLTLALALALTRSCRACGSAVGPR